MYGRDIRFIYTDDMATLSSKLKTDDGNSGSCLVYIIYTYVIHLYVHIGACEFT